MRLPALLHRAVAERVFGAAVCASLFFVGPPASNAAYLDQDLRESAARLDRAVTDFAGSTRAVLRAQSAETVETYANAIVDIVLSTDDAELSKLVNAGVDAALSVPPDAAASATRGLKAALASAPADACDVVPLPTAAIERVRSAVAKAAPAKQKALASQWEGVWEAARAAPRRAGGVCLPTPAAFDSAALAQKDFVESADPGAVAALQQQAKKTLGTVKKGVSARPQRRTRSAPAATHT